jgi:3-methylcrotonyl-CoA carboxylase alpha subunit
MKKERVQTGGQEYELEVVSAEDGRLHARIDGEEIEVSYSVCAPGAVKVGGQVIRVARVEGGRQVAAGGCHVVVEKVRRAASGERVIPPEVRPPMPAVVVKVLVTVGDAVTRGQPLVVVSAMKMETTLVAPKDGTVSEIKAKEGDKVNPSDVLVHIEEKSDA